MTLETALARKGFDFATLQTPEGLARLDASFLEFLQTRDASLADQLRRYRDGEELANIA